MATNRNNNRNWTQNEDNLLLELILNQTITHDHDAKYPVLTWCQIAACMNEFASGKAVVKLRLYGADEVEARYSELMGNSIVVGEMKRQSQGDEGASEARGRAEKEVKSGKRKEFEEGKYCSGEERVGSL